MIFSCIIIGGSYAGLSAALPLARARREILIIDSSQPRNLTASHSHGFLAQDHIPPSEITSVSITQLKAYPTVQFRVKTLVTSVKNVSEQTPKFIVETSSGESFTSHRIIFATGVSDIIPTVPGFAESWGKGVHLCPYCHGYEFKDGKIGVLASTPRSVHQAFMLTHWTNKVTLFTGGYATVNKLDLAPETKRKLVKMGVTIENRKILKANLDLENDCLRSLEVEGGVEVDVQAVFLVTELTMGSAKKFVDELGIETTTGFIGNTIIKVDIMKKTSVDGIYAAGEIAGSMNIPTSVGDGSMAGIGAHQSLVLEEITNA